MEIAAFSFVPASLTLDVDLERISNRSLALVAFLITTAAKIRGYLYTVRALRFIIHWAGRKVAQRTQDVRYLNKRRN